MQGTFKRIYEKIHAQRCVMQLLIIAAAVAADQLSKHMIMPMLDKLPGKTMPVIEGVFSLTYIANEGASFGILQGARIFFLVATAITLIVLGIYMVKARKQQPAWLRVCLSLVTAGAVGNFIDRLFYQEVVNGVLKQGLVRDFLDFSGLGFPYIFNVADACLVVGSIMLGIYLLFIHKEKDGKPLLARRGKKDKLPEGDEAAGECGDDDETETATKPEKEEKQQEKG